MTDISNLIESRLTYAIVDEIVSRIWNRYDAIEKLLRNGHNVYETTYGDRFVKLDAMRTRLMKKQSTYLEIIDMIYKIIKQ